ncbi:MAG: hypothetical protein ACYC0X_12240 [Pirellulaceae bacterium]
MMKRKKRKRASRHQKLLDAQRRRQGEQHKKIPMSILDTPQGRFVETQFREHLRAVRERLLSSSISEYDKCHTNLSWDNYSAVTQDWREDVEFVLLPTIAPDLLFDAIETERTSRSLEPIFRRISRIREFDDYEMKMVDLYAAELAGALAQGDLSFHTPSRELFPVVIRKVHRDNSVYAPQWVSNILVASYTLKGPILIPIIQHCRNSTLEFFGLTSFLHELIHVLQRVFRKQPVAAYPYPQDGRQRVRNPETFVQVGIEDELEVQKLMVAAGYGFKLEPIVYHRKSVMTAFRDTDPVEALDAVQTGIDRIEFRKYDGLYEGDLRGEILRAFSSLFKRE